MNNYPPGVTGNEPIFNPPPECKNCGGVDFDEDEEEWEDTDGTPHRARVLICADCGKVAV